MIDQQCFHSIDYPIFCSYKTSLQRLKIREEHVAKLVPNRIFSIAFHPARYKTLVFAGDKWGKLGIWDVVRTFVVVVCCLSEDQRRDIKRLFINKDNASLHINELPTIVP